MLTGRLPRWALRSTCLLALGLTPIAAAVAQVAAPPAPPAPSSAQAPQPVELFLETSIDGQPTGQIVSVIQLGATLRMTPESLRELGLDPARLGVAGRADFSLDEVRGMRWAYDPARQTLSLTLTDALREQHVLSARTPRPAGPAQVSRGMLLNYSLFGQSSVRSLAGALDLRYFDRHGSLNSTGAGVIHGPGRGYTRFDTTWVHSSQDNLSTWQVGDTVAPALSWTRAMRLGGIEWRRNFELRPDLVTYPVASVAGSAVVPTSLDLYLNGVRQFSAQVPTGPFVVDQVAGLNGAGQATVVTRDALGREVATTLPLYVDTRLLARGLSDFAVSVGALRRDYGLHSFRYGSPAALASWRHGWSDTLTLEAHAEAGRGLVLAGGGLLTRIPNAGVMSAALAASGGRRHGFQASVGYQYVSPRFAFDLQSVRASRHYADLGVLEGAPVPRATDRATVSSSWRGNSLSLSLIQLRQSLQADLGLPDPFEPGAGQGGVGVIIPVETTQAVSRTLALAWSRSVGRRGNFSLGAFQDLKRRAERGVTATFSMAFDSRVSFNANGGSQRGERTAAMSLARAPDFEGGLGWALQAGMAGTQRYQQAQIQYLGSHGRAALATQRAGGVSNTTVDFSGALVAMDGALLAARQVGRGFAMVSAGAPDLPVLQDNRLIGRTDAGGRLLVPDLQPYAANRIAIDPSSLPSDIRISGASQDVVPRQYAGVVARFEIERYTAATLMLVGPDSKPPAVGTPARLDGGNAGAVVGYDGILFVEGLRAHNRVLVGTGAAACEVRFDYKPVDGELPTIGPLVCQPVQGQ